jgi:hypothetical protein
MFKGKNTQEKGRKQCPWVRRRRLDSKLVGREGRLLSKEFFRVVLLPGGGLLAWQRAAPASTWIS